MANLSSIFAMNSTDPLTVPVASDHVAGTRHGWLTFSLICAGLIAVVIQTEKGS